MDGWMDGWISTPQQQLLLLPSATLCIFYVCVRINESESVRINETKVVRINETKVVRIQESESVRINEAKV